MDSNTPPGSYEVSVVTPFHNVDMGYFKGAVDSMLAQTIGFGRIEWIIVLHNCEPQYAPMLREMLGCYPNVVLDVLDNDARTPSSPRNRGVALATAPYVAYLDGDDSYTPDCLAACVRHARETDAQVVCFRRDYELESESLAPLNEIVLWNQLQERIVIEHGHWDMRRMFSGIWAFVTSKMFDRAFLLRHGIAFDEEIPYCEDSMYSMCALAQAPRICYLPQLIGYHYFINAASLVQTQRKDSKTLVAYARGMAKIIRRAYDFGIDINEFAQVLMEHQCNFMLHSDVTPEDRETIRQTLAPFVYRTVPVPPGKTVTREWSDYVFGFCRAVLLSPVPYAENQTLLEMKSGLLELRRILSANGESDYGQQYQFAALRTIAAYQFHVPLTRLSNYRKFVDLQIRIGEHGILTSERPAGYIRGDDGIVPFTDAHLRPYVLATAALLRGRHNLWVARCSLAGRQLNGRSRIRTLEGVVVRAYFFQCIYDGGSRPAAFSMPDNAFFSATDGSDDEAVILRFGLLDRDVDQIVASDARRLRRLFERLVSDRGRTLEELRREDPTRADEVAAALAEFDARAARGASLPPDGFSLAGRLWPKLRRIVAQGTGAFAADRDACRRFIGDTVWNNGCVLLPELPLARAVADGDDRYVFDGAGCFCEFFLNDSDDAAKPVARHALKAGHTYNVIVTNGAGLYRVVTDAVIRVVDAALDRLIVEVL